MDKEVILCSGDQLVIGEAVVTFLGMQGARIKLGFVMPPHVKILRKELYDRIEAERDYPHKERNFDE